MRDFVLVLRLRVYCPVILDFKSMSSWQRTKGEDFLKKEVELLLLVSFPLHMLLLHCGERPGKWGCSRGGTEVEMAKGAQTC